MSMSKIIVSSATLAQGGASRVCANLSTPLCDAFDTVIFVTWSDRPQFYTIDNRVKWYCVEKEAGGTGELKRMLWFRRLIKSERPDLILSFLEPWNLRVLGCTIGLGVKTIVAERTDPWIVNKYWVMQEFEKLMYSRADGILVQTPSIQKFFNGGLKKRTHIIYNPVNLPPEMVGKAVVAPKKKRIVFVGRLVPVKNIEILIKAFEIFTKSHVDYSLTIYGDGPLEGELKALVSSLNLSEKVDIPGPSKTIHQDILDAEMLCLVSKREGMSNTMIEAMTLGIPCICTKVSGAVDLIKDGDNGLLVDIGDIEGLALKMDYIATHKEEALKMGENATKVYELLNKDRIFKEWLTYLKEFVE